MRIDKLFRAAGICLGIQIDGSTFPSGPSTAPSPRNKCKFTRLYGYRSIRVPHYLFLQRQEEPFKLPGPGESLRPTADDLPTLGARIDSMLGKSSCYLTRYRILDRHQGV